MLTTSTKKEPGVLSKKVPVQMRFNQKTVNRVEDLIGITGISNRTQIVAQAIALYHTVELARKEHNASVILEYPNGTREKLVLM